MPDGETGRGRTIDESGELSSPVTGRERRLLDCGAAEGAGAGARGLVYMVTGDPVLRDRLRAVLRSANLEVTAFARAEDCLRALSHNMSECVAVVAEVPQAVEIAARQRRGPQSLGAPVVAITDGGNLAAAIEAMKAGVFDVVEKPVTEVRLVEALEAALREQQLRRERQQACLDVQRRYSELTAREREILHLVAAGLRSRAIAERLGIREKTVEVYRSRVNHKMNARNAAELAQMLRCIEL